MNIKVTKNDILWSYLAYIMKFCSGIFLLPILLTKLPSEHLGIWYVFLSIGSLMQLLDLGFSPTITRNVSYAFAGATTLKKEGINYNSTLINHPNYELIAGLLKVSRKIYLFVAIISLALLGTVGTFYINYISIKINNTEVMIAWIIYIAGIFLNFYYSYWIAFLTGIGKIQESQKSIIMSQIIYVLFIVMGLQMSFGIIAISFSFLISGFVLRIASGIYFKKCIVINSCSMTKEQLKRLYDVVWFNSKKLAVVFIGGFMIVQSNTLFCSFFFDLKTTASYGLSLQIISALTAISGILFRTYLPAINEARVSHNMQKIKEEVAKTFLFGLVTYIFGAIIIVIFGDMVLNFIKSETMLLETSMLIMMLVYLFLEFNHSNFATIITTGNEVPFMNVSIISGIGVVLLSMINVVFLNLGLWGLLIAQASVQALYNNWKWPFYVMKDIQLGLGEMCLLGYKQCISMILKRS